MVYKLTYMDIDFRFKNKDDLIYQLALWLGGDSVNPIRIEYPDGWVMIE
jgi:hypothetical protein